MSIKSLELQLFWQHLHSNSEKAMRAVIIFIFIIFSFCLPSYGQDSDETLVAQYENISDSLGKESDFKNAILYRKRSLNLLQAQSPVPYPKLVSCYRTIGFYYRQWGNFRESRIYQYKAVELAESHLPPEHIELAKAYNSLGSYYYNIGKFQQCYVYFNKALVYGVKYSHDLTGDFYNNVGIAQQNMGERDSALLTYKKALDYNEKLHGKYHKRVADNYLNIGTLYTQLGYLNNAIAHLDTAEMIQDSIYPSGAPAFAELYNNLGAVYTNKGDYRQSLDYLERGLKLYEKYLGGDHYLVANIYANIGLLLLEKGGLDKSLAYFKRAYSIRLQNFGEDNPLVAKTCLYLGKCHLEKKEFDESFYWLKRGVIIFQKLADVDPGELADAYNELGIYYKQVGNYKEALKQHDKALRINSKKIASDDPDVANSYSYIGQVYLLKKDFDNAEKYFNKSLTIRKKIYGEFHPDIADTYRHLALACSNDEVCLKEHLDNSFKAQQYIPGESEFDQVPSTIILLKTFQTKGELLKGLFLQKKDLAYLEEANKNYKRSIELIEFIKTSLEQPGSRLALQDNFYRIYEDAIWVKYFLFQEKNNKEYIHEAFKISEQSNAILLMEALQTVDVEKFAGIPDSLLELEHQLKIDLAYFEKKRFEEELAPNGGDSKIISDINRNILNIHHQYHDLLTELRKNHEEYFEMKYVPELVTINKIQEKLLRPEQTMLAYFVGDENVFAFIISKDSFDLIKIDKEFPLEVWVEEFRKSISLFNPAIKELEYLNQKFANIGHELYQLLFEPLKEKINTTSLIIVPGGMLGYLPFDALLASAPENHNDFHTHDYLIRHYQISYSYSATLLEEMIDGEHNTSPFIAFAPAYFGDTLNVNRSDDPWKTVLGQLKYNKKEILEIQKIMGGEVFTDSLATEKTFLRKAPKAGILHLATHGKSNDRNGEYSYLAFYQTQDSLENELLFVKNIYNLKIPASMVVLSACETGIGELQRGEGIISLARGFSYAGASSIITTMWNIDDRSSSSIMIDFYKRLKNKVPKDMALREAKLQYLNQMGDGNRTHPLFWAAYVPVGNMNSIEVNNTPYLPIILISFIVLLIIFYIWKIKKGTQ